MRRALAASLLWSTAAIAQQPQQQQPRALPTRDVDVTYESGNGAKAVQQRSRFSAELRRARLDTPTAGFYILIDYPAHTMMAVSDPDRGVIDMNAPQHLPGAVPDGAFTRRGQDQVAGLGCTEWQTTDSAGQPAIVCFTEDGVMLRARRGSQVLATATKVAYGPLDPALFAPPPGYKHLAERTAP